MELDSHRNVKLSSSCAVMDYLVSFNGANVYMHLEVGPQEESQTFCPDWQEHVRVQWQCSSFGQSSGKSAQAAQAATSSSRAGRISDRQPIEVRKGEQTCGGTERRVESRFRFGRRCGEQLQHVTLFPFRVGVPEGFPSLRGELQTLAEDNGQYHGGRGLVAGAPGGVCDL